MSDPIGYNGSFIDDDAFRSFRGSRINVKPQPLPVTHKALGFYKEGDNVMVCTQLHIARKLLPAWKPAVVTKAFDGCRLFVIGPNIGRYAITQPEWILPAQSSQKIMPQPGFLESLRKETNPKDAVGIRKVPVSCVPAAVVQEVGLAMLEGALKYGRHNYRIAGVRASVYYDAVMRHLAAWWEGQDIDPDSGLPHVTKAIACLTVIRDAMMNDKWTDDRPPPMKNQEWLAELNKRAGELLDKNPNPKAAFTRESK